MNTNAKRVCFGMLCGWVVTAAVAHAQTTRVGHAIQVAGTTVSQSSENASRREADELLRRGRAAIKDGNLDLARWCLDRAEKMDVTYDGLLQRFMDTPAKLRRDLEALEASGDFVASSESEGSDLAAADGPASVAEPATLPPPAAAGAEQYIENPYVGSSGASRPPMAAVPGQPVASSPWTAKRQEAQQLLSMSRAALNRGDLVNAEQFAQQAHALRVPDTEFGPGEPRPWMVLLEVDRAKRQGTNVAQVGTVTGPATDQVRSAAGYDVGGSDHVQLANSERLIPPPRVAQVQNATPVSPDGQGSPFDDDVTVDVDPVEVTVSEGMRLMTAGEKAVKERDFERARDLFRQAWRYEAELDPDTRQRLQDNLQLLRADEVVPPGPAANLAAGELEMVRRYESEIAQRERSINRLLRTSPKEAWEQLQELRKEVVDSEIPEDARRQLVARVDRSVEDAEAFIEHNRAKIEQNERDRAVLAEIDQRRKHRADVENELATLVDEFNTLMDQERFAEAVVLAKKARELDPDNVTVESMIWKSRFAERLMVEMSLRDRVDQGVVGALTSVSEAGVPYDDRVAIQFPEGGNAKYWDELTHRRRQAKGDGTRQFSESEMEIQRALRKKVQVDFSQQPLSQVLNHLGDLAGISIYLDPQGLAAEGATSDMPVTLRLNQEIQLKSALNIILQQFGLSYVIQDEVLKITSESIRASETYVWSYDVADLVIPIPNFMPSYNMGLPSALREAYQSQGFGAGIGGYNEVPLTVMANNTHNAASPQSVVAQMAGGMSPGMGASPQPLGFGPGGLGGGAQADFDTLIDLIVATIAPDTWDDVGGEGSIQGFPTNLSLVVSQTQEVHEQIADLLEQLRRLQDLQVTIEVRFITLSDNFFERIGVDFDFDIDDNVQELPGDDDGPSVTVGLDPNGNPTADLDLQFTQGSFGASAPAFGGFDAGTAANFGFAILSDIEAFFVIQAAQGDTRTNVLQAPKVTLFNGQQANVSDSSQRPFVTSVTPVVGDFAAAQAPIIVVLSEGTSLNVQAVVSNDRRFVRLTLVPFFSKIGDVEEFTFEGRRVSNTGTAAVDPSDENETVNNDAEEIIEGTTVQLPQFAFTSVSTTVSVPDGGTILLGGIKRLQEGRNERGVPILSKMPYVNRLFKNVGIGRTTSSLMMMVTPRIIIQEEEESKLGIASTGT